MSNIRRGLRIYCGNQQPLPAGYNEYGTRLYCFRKGFNVGRNVQEKTFAQRLREHTSRIEASTSAVVRRQLVKQIETEGISFLKRELHLDSLNKDLIRSIAVRLTGTADAIPRYSSMSKEQLIEALLERGFQR